MLKKPYFIYIIIIIIISLLWCYISFDNISPVFRLFGIGKTQNYPNVPLMDENNVSKNITINLVGDILLDRQVGENIIKHGPSFPFEKTATILKSSDLTIGNLENPISTQGTPSPDKKYTFRASPLSIESLKFAGFDVLVTANNHTLDYGQQAFLDTLNHLKQNNIGYIGAGYNAEEAYAPYLFSKNGIDIAIFAANRVIPDVSWYAGANTPGMAGAYSPDKLIKNISAYRKNVDYVLVYLHWGVEKNSMPEGYQRSLAKTLIDNGTDFVVGSHPHVLQGFEFYKNGLISYSLGNFVFTNIKNETVILNIDLKKDGKFVATVFPGVISNYRPELVADEALKDSFYKRFEDISFGVGINDGVLERK